MNHDILSRRYEIKREVRSDSTECLFCGQSQISAAVSGLMQPTITDLIHCFERSSVVKLCVKHIKYKIKSIIYKLLHLSLFTTPERHAAAQMFSRDAYQHKIDKTQLHIIKSLRLLHRTSFSRLNNFQSHEQVNIFGLSLSNTPSQRFSFNVDHLC